MLLKYVAFHLKFSWKHGLLWHLFWTVIYWSDGWKAVLFCNLALWAAEAVMLLVSVASDLRKERRAKEFVLRVDEAGVEVRTYEGVRNLLWEQIYRLQEEKSTSPWKPSSCESLIGEDGEVLANWDSNWAHFVYRHEESLQLLAAREAIRQKLRDMGRIVVPKHQFKCVRGPQIPRQVRNHLAIIGSIGLFFLSLVLVDAGFPWGQSTTPFALALSGLAISAGIWCLALIARNQGLRVSPGGIESYTIWRRRTLSWSQVQRVGLDERKHCLVFETTGGPLHFQFNGLAALAGLGKADVLRFVKAYCEANGIPLSSNL